MFSFVKKNVPGIFWSFLTFFVSTLPGKDLPIIDILNFDKIAHLGFYAVFYFMTLWGLSRNYSFSKKKVQIICISYTVLFGVLMEFIQGNYIPQRFFDPYDALANTLGVILAAILFLTIPFLRPLFERK